MCERKQKECRYKREKWGRVNMFVFNHKDSFIQSFIWLSIIICFQFELSHLDTYFLLGFPPGAVAFRISELKHHESFGSEQMSGDIRGIVTLVTNKRWSQSCSV